MRINLGKRKKRNENGQQIDRTRKNIIKIFKDIGFGIDIETNSKVVDFLDITFNLNNGMYKPYKKPNDRLLYINKSSNHPPQIINQLSKLLVTDYQETPQRRKCLIQLKESMKKP